jgi:endonuclease YncB( thermonuclease family)
LATILLVATGIAGARLPHGFAAEPSHQAQASAAAAPPVEEWLNQPVRLRATVTATRLPSADATPLGEIRAGAEVKAIGLVGGKHWVQIELPDGSRAYVPRESIQFEDSAAPPSPAPPGALSSPAATVSSPAAASAPALTPTAPSAASGAPGAPASTPAAAPATIRGKVSRVPNSATLVVGDQRVRLSGIDPGPAEVLAPFEKWVEAQGDIACEPDAQTGRYRCMTTGGVDVAEAAILNGAGRVGDGASPEYRSSETQAREAKRGLWAEP